MPFASLGLGPALIRAASELGFAQPTPIQSEAIPALLRGADLRAMAQTGSGKTAAYALPLLQRLAAAPTPTTRKTRLLVLVPTRELAAQVGELMRSLAQHLEQRLKVAIVFGGVSINPQMMGLRGGADVVVATPGRLLDLLTHNALKLGAVQALVLDEADRLLDLGFADELSRILATLPPQRQTVLCSATFPEAVQTLASTLMREPVVVDVPAPPTSEPVIEQRAYAVDSSRRTQLLRHLFKEQAWKRAMVFVATQYAAETLSAKLYKSGVFATPFHGGLSQGARTEALDEFKAERWDMLITTDLAARGIDIAQLPVVVNFDLPRSAVDYLHRIGRTGRAGESGLAVSFVSAATEAHFRLIEKRQGMMLPLETMAGFEPTEVAVAQDPSGGIKGKRPSKKDKLRAAGVLPKQRDASVE